MRAGFDLLLGLRAEDLPSVGGPPARVAANSWRVPASPSAGGEPGWRYLPERRHAHPRRQVPDRVPIGTRRLGDEERRRDGGSHDDDTGDHADVSGEGVGSARVAAVSTVYGTAELRPAPRLNEHAFRPGPEARVVAEGQDDGEPAGESAAPRWSGGCQRRRPISGGLDGVQGVGERATPNQHCSAGRSLPRRPQPGRGVAAAAVAPGDGVRSLCCVRELLADLVAGALCPQPRLLAGHDRRVVRPAPRS